MTIAVRRYCSRVSVGNRPARLLFGQYNTKLEKAIAIKTLKDYINKYGFNPKTEEELRIKRRAIEYYLKSVIEGRPSLANLADNMLNEIDQNTQVPEWGKQKAYIAKMLGFMIPNEVTIEEWRGVVKICEEISK